MNDPDAEHRGIKKGSRTKKEQFEAEPQGIKPKRRINKGIFVEHSEVNNKYVDVGPIGKPIFQIDISEYSKEYTSGYLFFEKGRKIKYFKYDLSNETLLKASKYFKLNLSDSGDK